MTTTMLLLAICTAVLVSCYQRLNDCFRRWMERTGDGGNGSTHADAEGATESLALGYLRAHLLMTSNELTDLKGDLERFAETEGYALGRVFVERIDRVPAAFGALLDAIEEQWPGVVVIPSDIGRRMDSSW